VLAPEFGVGAGLAVLVLIFTLLHPGSFATFTNASNLLGDSSLLIVVAMATTFVLITGNLDLSIGSVVAFSEVLSAKAMIAVGGNSLLTCLTGLAVALASGLGWGSINGFLITRAKIPPFIVTLATLGIALGGADLLAN
jgi:ribose transport system permease protein